MYIDIPNKTFNLFSALSKLIIIHILIKIEYVSNEIDIIILIKLCFSILLIKLSEFFLQKLKLFRINQTHKTYKN